MELDLDKIRNDIVLLEQDKLDKSELDLAMHKFMLQTPSQDDKKDDLKKSIKRSGPSLDP